MSLSCEQVYWADIAKAFIDSGNKVTRIDDSNRHAYLSGGISVQTNAGGRFNLGCLVSDTFLGKREDLGMPESEKFRTFIRKLTTTPSLEVLSQFDNVALTEEPDSEIQGYKFVQPFADKIATIDINYLMLAPQFAQNLAGVSQKLEERANDSKALQEDHFMDGRKFAHATSLKRSRVADISRFARRLLYDSIPNVKQKENDFLMAEMALLKHMGLNLEQPDPYLSALNATFADVAKPDESPFHPMSYHLMGGRINLFLSLLGEEVMGSVKYIPFDRPEGENKNRTEFDRKAFMKRPGVVFACSDVHETGHPEKAAFFEVKNQDLTTAQRSDILNRALALFNPLKFGEIVYARRLSQFPYASVEKDLAWVVANLDHSKLYPNRIVINGSLAEELRKFPIYKEGHEGDSDFVIGEESRPVRCLDLGKEIMSFPDYCEFGKTKLPLGTKILALEDSQSIEGYDFPVAVPFQVGEK